MSYNAANVHDLAAGFDAVDSSGTNAFEPHPWGGVPGIFKEFTTEAGLNYDMSISARNAAPRRGQFLDTASSAWDLRGNVASKSWDVAVLQDQSDVSLPTGNGKNANNAQFQAYVSQFVNFIHDGAAETTPRRSCTARSPTARPPATRRPRAASSARSRPTRTPIRTPRSTSPRPGRGPTWCSRT